MQVQQMDLIQLEIEQLKHQIDLLDAVYTESLKTKKDLSYCESLKISIKDYLYYAGFFVSKENFLHKLGYCQRKEE